ncbi:MAG: sigma-E factor negative regulatory protein [Pseudomonadota bacterium]|nr:sigma-E factor negative regulatory protein [Pseudomonadota bacterium]
MNPQTPEEQLSALLDGELDADRSRFLLRRLQHDDALADTLSRWQLAADVLRGQGSAAASDGFVARFSARLAAEAPPTTRLQPQATQPEASPQEGKSGAARPPARWRYFAGGAMAASLAFAAFIGLRAPEPGHAPAAIATVQPQAPETVAAAAEAALPEARPAAETPITAPQAAAVQPAARQLAQAPRAASRSSRVRNTPAPAATVANDLPQVAQNGDVVEARDPFSPPQSRPAWPRAVLPGTGNSTFNVRLEHAPSASPFEPHPNNQD